MKADTVDRFYNVGTGKRTSLKELAESASQSHRLQSADSIMRHAARRRLSAIALDRPSSRRKRSALTRNSICDEGLRDLIAWRKPTISDEVDQRRAKAQV